MKTRANGSSGFYLSTKRFHITNLGCAKNQVDAEILVQKLGEEGWTYTEDPQSADVLLVNTCGFIESAKEESLETVFRLRKQYPDKIIIMSGCLSQRYGEKLQAIVPEVDGFFGNKNLAELPKFLGSLSADGPRTLLPERKMYFPGREYRFSYPGSVYIKIAEGCSNRCSFCAIPQIRGDFISRPIDDVYREVKGYIDEGVFELVLIGQDLGSYGEDVPGNSGIVELCRRLADIPGDFWVRLLYIHPDHFPDELLGVFAESGKLLPYFDLPFQHASPAVLRAMGRKGDAEQYLRLIRKIRRALPAAVIRSTFMTGFPGEGEEDFEELLRFQREAELDWLGIFTYSPEEGTPARDFPSKKGMRKVPKKTAEKRKKILEENQVPLTENRLARFVGTEQMVLLEEKVEGEDLYIGRGYMDAPEVDGLIVVRGRDLRPGERILCRIENLAGVDLEAVPGQAPLQ